METESSWIMPRWGEMHLPTPFSGVLRLLDWCTGITSDSGEIQAIQDAPKPQNVAGLKSYLGLLTYYSKFLLNLSSVLSCSTLCLVETQPTLEMDIQKLLLSLIQVLKFISHVMCQHMDWEQFFHTWCQIKLRNLLVLYLKLWEEIEKQALVCVVGINSYMCGHWFILQTDHKPLLMQE